MKTWAFVAGRFIINGLVFLLSQHGQVEHRVAKNNLRLYVKKPRRPKRAPWNGKIRPTKQISLPYPYTERKNSRISRGQRVFPPQCAFTSFRIDENFTGAL